MLRPNSYDEVKAGGDYTPVELGGHKAVIKRVEETTSKSGKPMIKVAIDFDKKDAQANYFMDAFKADTREDKKWPYQATQYILTEDNEGKCSRSFKSFITAVEDSNNAEVVWGEKFEAFFTNKKIGVVFGENEEEYNGEVKTRRKIRYFCNYEKALDQKVPDKKFLATATTTTASASDFMQIPEGAEDEIPF